MQSILSEVSPRVVTGFVAVATVAILWYMRRQSGSVQCQSGYLILTPNPSSIAEYKRDLERFKKCGGIDGWTDSMESQMNDPIFAYCMSTSFGMDVLLELKIIPPVVHQPMFVVQLDPLSLTFFGFIGTPKGSFHPEKKFSNQVLTVKRDGIEGEKIRVYYEIRTCGDSNGPKNIRECLCCKYLKMERFGWYRRKFVNGEMMEKDPCQMDRETLRKYKVYVVSVRNWARKFDVSLGKSRLLHEDLNRDTREFFCTSKKEEQVNRTSAIGEAFLSVGSSYDECRGEFVLFVNRANLICNTIKAMEKRLKDRDFAYWEKKHYEVKTEKMHMNPKNLGTERMDNNLRKLADAQKKYDELDQKIIEDLQGLNCERFDEMENLLKMYLVHLDKYYSGINSKINDVAEKELKISASFKLTPLVQRAGDSALQQSLMLRQQSGTSTMPSGVIKATKGGETVNEGGVTIQEELNI